jgi:signal transduction histidine kinase/DNA-binding NarL/FixJ family response regulator
MIKAYKNLIVFLAFFIAFGGILLLQYKSYTSTRHLIQTNQELLEEMDYTNNVQFFQTHLLLFDQALQNLISNQDEESIKDLKREIKIISLSLNYIKTFLSNQHYDLKINDFEIPIKSKLAIGNELIVDLETNKSLSEDLVSKANQLDELNNSINSKLIELEDLSENNLKEKTELINQEEQKSLQSNLFFAIISSLLFGLALYYIFSQISRQNQLIDALHSSQEKEKSLAKIKESFLANMSHEIRTPLNAIMGFTTVLEKESISDKAKELVATIKSSGAQLVTIVNQILDISKIEEGMIRIEHQPFLLASVIDKIDDTFRMAIESKGLTYSIIRDFNPTVELIGDEYRWIQILTNLIGNAVKFTSTGEIKFTIQDLNNSKIQFIVSDTGIGIAENKLETIFERFEQADNHTTRKYGGSGLGLSIVKHLVEILQGTIEVKSQENKGSEFSVILSFSTADINALPKVDNNEHFKQINIDAKILVVEDNAINLKLIEHWFNKKNLEFNSASTGSEAIAILSKSQYDIILMDIQMPDMDGIECTEFIRNTLHHSTPIIGMTAHTMKHEIIRCYEAGMNSHISKPIDEDRFFKLIGFFLAIDNSVLVSREYLTELSKGDERFIKDILNEFLNQTPLEIEKLTTAFYSENLAEIKTIAHTLKTNFSYLGADAKLLILFQVVEEWTEIPVHYNHLYIINYLFEKSRIKATLLLSQI